MYIVYGIPNCDTVKKALLWLQKNKIPFAFYDYKKEGIRLQKLKLWSNQVGWENLVNKKGTTWRQMEETIQVSITNEKAALHLLQEKTSMIKRPLIEKGETIITLGFDATVYAKVFIK